MHQSLRPVAGPTVLTAYWALGHGERTRLAAQRQALLDEPWSTWSRRVVDDLARAHPDLAGYSIFEEAFTLGQATGDAAARRVHG